MLVVYPLEEEENRSIAKRLRLMLSDVALLKVREDVCNTGTTYSIVGVARLLENETPAKEMLFNQPQILNDTTD